MHHPPKDADRQWYSGRRWRKLREWILAGSPLCADPEGRHAREGRVVPATDVDHIVPRLERPDLAFEETNLQPLCRSCHSRKTRRESKPRPEE